MEGQRERKREGDGGDGFEKVGESWQRGGRR